MRRRAGAVALLVFVLALAGCGRAPGGSSAPAAAPRPQLIERSALFGDPVRAEPTVSPDGATIAFLAPRSGVMNLWVVATAGIGGEQASDARPVTGETAAPIRDYWWSADSTHLIYALAGSGDDQRLAALDLATGETRVLTDGGRAEVLATNPAEPTSVLITLYSRDPAWPDVYRVDLSTGARARIETNSRRFFRYIADREGRVRLGLNMRDNGSVAVWARAAGEGWRVLLTVGAQDALSSTPLEFEQGGASFLMLDSTSTEIAPRDRAALVRVNAQTGERTVLGESTRADVFDVWVDPTTGAPEAFASDYLRRDWRALDEAAQGDLSFLDARLAGEAHVVSRSRDDNYWLVTEDGPVTPPQSYLYARGDPNARRLTLLFRHNRELGYAPLQPMTPVEIESRDGLTLVSYLTLPRGSDRNGDSRPDAPLPLVIVPHAMAWMRDSYGFNAVHQWLADRGYAVLSVNVRGSAGFGRAFLEAGARQWGAAMQNDLLDAAQWAVSTGIARGDRVALFGERFGGYAALMGLGATPDRFACAVARAAPMTLDTAFAGLSPREQWLRPQLALRIGDVTTEEARAARSPLSYVAALRRPLLLVASGRDAASPAADNDAMAGSARGRRAGLVYLFYPEEGAAFSSPAARLSFYAVADQFLSGCLGGPAEPLSDAFEGVRAQALVGSGRIAGLRRAAPPPAPPPSTEPALGLTATPSAAGSEEPSREEP